MRTGKGCEF